MTTEHQAVGNKKVIMKVFWILLVVTLIEVFWGAFISSSIPKWINALFFFSLTIVKAVYIVAEFMHLKHETAGFIRCILIPLLIFVWFIIAFCLDGKSWLKDRYKYKFLSPTEVDTKVNSQKH